MVTGALKRMLLMCRCCIQQTCISSQAMMEGMHEKIQKALDCIASTQSVVDALNMCSTRCAHMRVTISAYKPCGHVVCTKRGVAPASSQQKRARRCCRD
jgi:hypothetical protein